MIEQLPFLLWPFIGLLCVAAIHVYLGLHVVERGVIFVDLALAQMAVLGAAVATFWGFDPHEPRTYAFALGATVLGAATFAITRSERDRIPQEAVIGIVYAVAAAATVLILNNAPHGAEHIRDVLVGQLLSVDAHDVLRLAVLYAGLGVLFRLWHRRLFAVSQDPHAQRAEGTRVKAWDFLFYLAFGLTVTVSVDLCGVLVVFSYLIVPNVMALLFAGGVRSRLALGWVFAALASALGMLSSVWLSAPPGASVVCAFGALLLAGALAAQVVGKSRAIKG